MCTDVVIEENTYYMVLKKLDGYDWPMLMLVPTDEVAVSTREMTNSLIRVFMMILAVILLLILASVLFVTKFRNSSHPLEKKIPILAMTANAFSEDVQNAFNAGMNVHIVKPVDMKVLIKTVWNLQTGAGAAGTLN